MRRTIGGNSQDRRRARRAANRRLANLTLSPADERDIRAMIAAASGSTSLPLSDQSAAWDAGAAQNSLDEGDYSKAYFWRDPDGDPKTKAAYKLPFASKAGGTLTAIWRGVTAAAGAVQGARGGVSIPDADMAGVKSRIASYYSKASKKFDDDSIKPPWSADESTGETAAFLLAYAECSGALSREPVEGDMVFCWFSTFEEDGTTPREDFAAVYTTDEEAFAVFETRLAFWETALDKDFGELFEILTVSVPGTLGGDPSKGTKKDKRLKKNKGGDSDADMPEDDEAQDDDMAAQPELAALDAVDDFAASVKCGCGHAYSEHSGAGGSCGHEDGRGTCRCGEFAYPDSEVQALADAIVAARPDLAGFESDIAKIAQRTLLALAAAAGDVAWGPEEGVMDLLCDINALLHPNEGDTSWWPAAIDVSVNLDKVLICDEYDYFVAALNIGGDGEPVLADRADWIEVEDAGYIETKMERQSKLKFRLEDFTLTAAGADLEIPEATDTQPEASSEIKPPESQGGHRWTATFVPEGVLTEDGRAFAPGAIILPPDEQARQLPLTLMGLVETSAEGGHDRAKVAGRIDEMWREDGKVKAAGVFSEDEWGQKIEALVAEGSLKGLSVDIAPLNWEHVSKADWFNEDGEWIAVQDEETGEWSGASGEEPTEEDMIEALFSGDLVLAITKAVIGMATVCPFPAFGQAEISLTASGIPSKLIVPAEFEIDCGCQPSLIETITAAGAEVVSPPLDNFGSAEPVLTAAAAGLAPVSPPAEWFANPEFDELTPLTITEDGQIFGHAWQWDTCHLSFDQCVTAPHSETNYAYYLLGEIECEGGERLSVGKITLDAPHAGTRLSRSEATAHYDNTGTVAAHVSFGEDEFGGWFAGAINPELSEEKLRILRGSTVSGDWRGVDGNLELVALLACNVPGFPVPRSLRASVEMGEDGEPVPVALVAAGIVTKGLEDEIQSLVAEVAEE